MGIPDISINRIRKDFTTIFDGGINSGHKRTVVIERFAETEAGNYGYVDEASGTTTSAIEMSVQGISSDSVDHTEYGITGAGSNLKGYIKYDTVIKPTDIFIIDGKRYRFEQDHNKGFKGADVGFQELTLIEQGTDTESGTGEQ